MAEYLKEIIGDQLYVPHESDFQTTNLPSPEELRNFVVLVAKKLPRGVVDDAEFYAETEEQPDQLGEDQLVDPSTEGCERIDMNIRESAVRKKYKIAKALSDLVYVKEGQFKGFVYAKDDGKSDLWW